ncbi:MAG: linked oxidase domain protein [Bryobacterales bacterium]|nr:linked oxidase domain protein [Bryobacterales bacterium]
MEVTDASGYAGHADRIVAPRDEPELLAVLAEARENHIPVTIAGAGTGVTGGRVPRGAWSVSLEKFCTLEIGDCSARVGAGAILKDVHAAAARTKQFYAPDPTETWASIGGTIATNASGSRSFRYGGTRAHVTGLRVALMDGRVLEIRRGDRIDFAVPELPAPRTTKHTAGYFLRPGMDWVDLFIGSEGTLGVVISAELRLLPEPKELLAAVVFFATDGDALQAVDDWRAVDELRMIEYFDGPSLALLRARYPEIPEEAQAALLIEQEVLDERELDRWGDRLEAAGALLEASWFGASPDDRERFRRFRHALPELVNDTVRRNGCLKMGTDFAVPIDRNREMLAIYRRECEAIFPGRYVIFGHIGDAHLHVNMLPANEVESNRARDLMIHFAKEAVALGGTVSAEHGLGKRKAHLLAIEFTREQIEAMKDVKRRLDPDWLLGQGNLFAL